MSSNLSQPNFRSEALTLIQSPIISNGYAGINIINSYAYTHCLFINNLGGSYGVSQEMRSCQSVMYVKEKYQL